MLGNLKTYLSSGSARSARTTRPGSSKSPPTLLGGDTAPLEAALPIFPVLEADSYVTIGFKIVPLGAIDITGLFRDWDTCAFNCNIGGPGCEANVLCGETNGGSWLVTDSSAGQGSPDENGNVIIGVFTVGEVYNVGGTLAAFEGDGMTEFDFEFECFPVPVCEPENCDDGNGCTEDSCVDLPGGGQECQYYPVNTSDGIDCTDDFCDPADGSAVNMPNDANCDDGLFCNGAETCDPIQDCQAGSDPCIDPDLPICNEDAGQCQSAIIALSLDIKPRFCPNGIKRGANATVWVGLLGTSDFDITQVDPPTITLSRADGGGEAITPQGNPRFKDVATPFGGELCNCHAAGKDGILDLRAKFKTATMEPAFGFDAEPTGTVIELSLTGTLLDGTPFSASDCIRIDR